MSYWTNYGQKPLALRVGVALIVTAASLVLPAHFDHWGYYHLYYARVYEQDWGRLLRVMGFWPTWLVVGLAVWLHRPSDPSVAKRNAWLIAGSSAAGGLLCEVMKLLIRRERPDVDAGHWVFRPWNEQTWSTAGLSTPSSHTVVAFAGATMAARLVPRARWVFYALAWGCGLTRVLSHAHYVSDVTFGALLGWAVGWGVWIQVSGRGKA